MLRPARTLFVLAVLGLVSLGPVVAAGAASADPLFGHQWGMERIGAPEAWATGTGEGTVVAVIDSGVDASHPDLAANVGAGRDFIDPGTPPDDANGHGTHVAGVVGAVTGNGVGVAGVAGGTEVMPVRVLDDEGFGTLGQVEDGIRYAVDRGADVINLSLGGDVVIENLTGGSLAPAIDEAWKAGVVVVVAAGNDALFPSGYRNVDAIVVSATGPQDEKPTYSNGVGLAKWGMAAPGGNSAAGGETGMILSTYWSEDGKERYAWAQGTSMATPHVAGAAAVLRGLGLGPRETVDRLLGTARDIGSPGDDLVFGAGRLDVAAAVEGLGAVRDRGETAPGPAPTPGPSEAPQETSSAREAPAPETPTATEEPAVALERTPGAAVERREVPDPDEEGVVAVDAPPDRGGSSGLAGVVAVAMVAAAAVGVALSARARSGAGEQSPE